VSYISLSNTLPLAIVSSVIEAKKPKLNFVVSFFTRMSDQQFLKSKLKEVNQINALRLSASDEVSGKLVERSARPMIKTSIQKIEFYQAALEQLETEFLEGIESSLHLKEDPAVKETLDELIATILSLKDTFSRDLDYLVSNGMGYPIQDRELLDIYIPNYSNLEWRYEDSTFSFSLSRNYQTSARAIDHLQEVNSVLQNYIEEREKVLESTESVSDLAQITWDLKDANHLQSFIISKINGISKRILVKLEEMDQLSLETEEDLGRLGNIMRRLEVEGMEKDKDCKILESIMEKTIINESYFGSKERSNRITELAQGLI